MSVSPIAAATTTPTTTITTASVENTSSILIAALTLAADPGASSHNASSTAVPPVLAPYNVTEDGSGGGGGWLPTRPTPGESPSCDKWSHSFTVMYSILAVVFLLFGVLLTFFGYRFFKVVMFLTGFVFSSVLVYMVLEEQRGLIPPEGSLGAAAGAGLLVGLVAMLLRQVGLFLTGLNVGVGLVIAALIGIEQLVHPPSKWIPIGALLGIGAVFGILALKFQKKMTILGTSVMGGAIGVAGVDYFVEISRMALYAWDRVLAQTSSGGLCWYSWLVLGLWPCLILLGILIQWRVTGVDVDHRMALRSRKEQAENEQLTRARQKRDSQQTRYRHLYQARRVKGDVISQNFLQSIQDKLSPAMRSLTALNTEPNNDEESTATTTLTQIT